MPNTRGTIVTMRAFVIACLVCGVAHAQPKDPGEAAYVEGKRLYDIQDWDAAIAKFKESYKLRNDAASLFNIAQAYRLKGDCVQASTFYRTYKRNFPTAANIAAVDKFIAELEPCVKSKGEKPTSESKPVAPKPRLEPRPATPPTTTEPGATASPPPIATEPEAPRSLVLPIVVGAGAVVLGGTALAFELSARSTYDESTREMDDAKQQDLYTSANTQRYIADGFAVASVITAGVAVVLLLRHNSSGDGPAVQPTVTAHGGGVQLVGRF